MIIVKEKDQTGRNGSHDGHYSVSTLGTLSLRDSIRCSSGPKLYLVDSIRTLETGSILQKEADPTGL